MTDWYNTFGIAMTLGVLAEKGVLSLGDVLYICLVSIVLSAAVQFISGFWNAIKEDTAARRRVKL